ncbi:hypothetical protein IU436_16585 [Nocardia farcinica]|uniref:hypothetical protein n=1 Tax=Nocardia farcinica TaxID=37329 RepID=UPI001894582A|nr:hypothetical protein [Nocardia farcinica]MBF6260170.1 hypothetical protein [Nocardia farcinica]MBF6420733.1 hypothetical protein [Nocardia farcinica]MBF6431977.1 hypothetical protein [Nocardia farcinica]MBF6502687.1 hypothetical protein [Nocardia farcinica]MBF6520679.1 hypothetical protein [Nocardia farcinica]
MKYRLHEEMRRRCRAGGCVAHHHPQRRRGRTRADGAGSVPAGSSSTGSATVMDPLLCAPAIGMVIQALGDNLYGSLLPSICAMR